MSKPSVSTYQQIYHLVDQIPQGQVATYGQIAQQIERCTARMVGYAMAHLPTESQVPWHRVVNAQGRISRRSYGEECPIQKDLLRNEGILFDKYHRIDLSLFGWKRKN